MGRNYANKERRIGMGEENKNNENTTNETVLDCTKEIEEAMEELMPKNK